MREPLEGVERGFLLETWILHELRAAMARLDTGGQIHYWRTPGGSEVDFVWTRADHAVGFEVKAATRWKKEYGVALKSLVAGGFIDAGFGVYPGAEELQDGPLRILPLKRFFVELTEGRVLR